MKRLLFPLFLLIALLSLASCGDDKEGSNETNGITDSDESNDKESSIPNRPSQTGGASSEGTGEEEDDESAKLPAEYRDPDGSYETSAIPSPSTPVEETVELVYDSVVSINVTAPTFSSSGSGVLFSEDTDLGLSYIVTCFHVIENGTRITITLTDGTTYPALVVGGYRDQDLAILSIEATELTYAKLFTDSDSLKLGSQVVCIGNPLGTLPGSISSGYLSYINREIQIDTYTTMELLQTDVAINSGNSGGGLFNTSGALIGIVNAKYADEAIEGLGFAIPINTVSDVIENIFETAQYDIANKEWKEGYYEGDWELGVTISSGYYFGQPVVYIYSVSSNITSVGALQLRAEDIIQAAMIDYADETMEDITISFGISSSTLLSAIYSSDIKLNDKIIFNIYRDGSSINIECEVEQFIYSI
ncbi:MAG: trypsin-like serine protease [Erysipelotrichaceae bacterium]|nr:trypsin-like serine protease [Erysipelotrichaceae bacterium]